MSVVGVNVKTLSPRVGILLGWGFDVIATSEVRVAQSAMRSLARVARASNYDVVFGIPPPPSPSLAVFARLPRTVRKLHPQELVRWEDQGRVLVVDVIHADLHVVVVAVYGFALSHPNHGATDDMLCDCLEWSGCQKVPVIMVGDLNETMQTSPALVSAHEHKMTRVSPDTTTTAGKNVHLSKNLPLDHALVNQHLRDSVIESVLRHDLPLADHFPVVTTFLTQQEDLLTWQWPKPNQKNPGPGGEPWCALPRRCNYLCTMVRASEDVVTANL